MKTNFFVQPNGQSRTYSSYAVARKSALKRNFLFRWFIGITLLCGLMGQGVYAYSGKDSRNGEDLSAQGTLRVLVVFAEITGDPNYSSPTGSWVAGKMPPNADKLFDTKVYVLGSESANGQNDDRISAPSIVFPGQFYYPTNVMTKFFYDASFGNLVVTGDYYPELIQIPYSQLVGKYDADQKVMDVLAAKSNLKSSTGLSIPGDFDAWTQPGDYLEKTKTPDGKIDNLIIIYRVNSRLTTTIGAGHSGTVLYSANRKLQTNCYQSMRTYDFLTSFVVPHEFSHALLGGNNYHNGSAGGAGIRRFMTEIGGYGILENFYLNLRSCNAWDRYRLGWKQNKNYPNIYACDLSGNVVSGDISYRVPTAAELKALTVPTTKEYVLRDFVTTGDAIRIQLPYLEQGGTSVEPQWIWLENHVKDSTRVYYAKGATHPMGVRINLQIGTEKFDKVNGDYIRMSYYAPFNRFGRWDFDVIRTPVKSANSDIVPNLPFIPELDSLYYEKIAYGDARYSARTASDKSNAFTGNSLLEFLNYDVNGDGKLQDNEVFKIENFYKDNVRIGGDVPILGNAYDVFRVGDVLSLATNPATTPWLTHRSINGSCEKPSIMDNRKIYLNGLKIQIREKRADGSVVVAVTQDYYTVDQNQRWCGDIVLNEKISLNAGKRINLALGKTPIIKEKETSVVINNKRYFTEPTVLTCMPHSVLSLSNSTMEVDSLCALVLKTGSIVENLSSGSTLIRIKRGGTLVVESGVSIGKGILFAMDEGSYACVDGAVKSGMSFSDGGSVAGVHPYVQQTKNLSCVNIKAKSGYNKKDPAPDTTPVYQSFFEGDPVYKQTWGKYEYKWYEGVTIKSHGLEGDTVVDGLLYQKMSVGGPWPVQFWVRENETRDKVWVRLPGEAKGQDRLVVDMNLKQGDLFPIRTEPDTVYYEVDTVYYMEHAGGNLKHIRLKPTTDSSWTKGLTDATILLAERGCNWHSRHLEFIEGVGSNLGFMYYRLGQSGDDYDWRMFASSHKEWALYDYIVCLKKEGRTYYMHPNPECVSCANEFIVLDDDVIYDESPEWPPTIANERVQSMSRHLVVSPNPAAETATLQWGASADSRVTMSSCRITLYDMQGVRLRSYTTDSWPYTLSVSDLTPGAYLLRVVPAEQSVDGAWQATVRLMVR